MGSKTDEMKMSEFTKIEKIGEGNETAVWWKKFKRELKKRMLKENFFAYLALLWLRCDF